MLMMATRQAYPEHVVPRIRQLRGTDGVGIHAASSSGDLFMRPALSET
jgi:hypothetical protein